MEIVFIRHGQTDVNKDKRLQGAQVDADLNEFGRNFAKESAKKFDPTSFDHVFVSPLKRAVETAEIFTKGQKDLVRDKRLLEFDFGDWDGKRLSDIQRDYPDAVDPWGTVNINYAKYAKNGESYEEFEARCASFLDEIYAKYHDQKILVVAHGRLIRMMSAHLIANGQMDNFNTMDNCGLAKFSMKKNHARMYYYNRVLA